MMLTLQILSIRTVRYQAPLICNFEIAALAKVSMDYFLSKTLNNVNGILDSFLNATDSLIRDFGSGASPADSKDVYRLGK